MTLTNKLKNKQIRNGQQLQQGTHWCSPSIRSSQMVSRGATETTSVDSSFKKFGSRRREVLEKVGRVEDLFGPVLQLNCTDFLITQFLIRAMLKKQKPSPTRLCITLAQNTPSFNSSVTPPFNPNSSLIVILPQSLASKGGYSPIQCCDLGDCLAQLSMQQWDRLKLARGLLDPKIP